MLSASSKPLLISPLFTLMCLRRFPLSCTRCESSALASTGLVTIGSTSISILIDLSASWAISCVSAATITTASPTYRTFSPTPIKAGQSWMIKPWLIRPGISSAVSTARTPGNFFALEISSFFNLP